MLLYMYVLIWSRCCCRDDTQPPCLMNDMELTLSIPNSSYASKFQDFFFYYERSFNESFGRNMHFGRLLRIFIRVLFCYQSFCLIYYLFVQRRRVLRVWVSYYSHLMGLKKVWYLKKYLINNIIFGGNIWLKVAVPVWLNNVITIIFLNIITFAKLSSKLSTCVFTPNANAPSQVLPVWYLRKNILSTN